VNFGWLVLITGGFLWIFFVMGLTGSIFSLVVGQLAHLEEAGLVILLQVVRSSCCNLFIKMAQE
jgi:hypothetical protein